jgi:7-cyano-7-deazaguanine synthase in queuosine biosynthesis
LGTHMHNRAAMTILFRAMHAEHMHTSLPVVVSDDTHSYYPYCNAGCMACDSCKAGSHNVWHPVP